MNRRIAKKQRRNNLLDDGFGVLYLFTLRGMKKIAKECVCSPYKGRYTGRGLGAAHYYKCVGSVPVYTQCPKFRKGKAWEVLSTGTASACCIWRILADREARTQYLQRIKGEGT